MPIVSNSRRSCVAITNVPFVVGQRALELLDRGQIQMVRGLVQEQQVGSPRGEHRQGGPGAFAGRKLGRGPLHVVGSQLELRQQ